MLDGIGRIKKPGKLLKQFFFTFVQLLWPIECKYLEYDSHETAYGPMSIVYFSCSRQLQHTLKNSKSVQVSDYRFIMIIKLIRVIRIVSTAVGFLLRYVAHGSLSQREFIFFL